MATEMLHAGVSLVILARRLDHRRVSTTLDQYAHAVPAATPRPPQPLADHAELGLTAPTE